MRRCRLDGWQSGRFRPLWVVKVRIPLKDRTDFPYEKSSLLVNRHKRKPASLRALRVFSFHCLLEPLPSGFSSRYRHSVDSKGLLSYNFLCFTLICRLGISGGVRPMYLYRGVAQLVARQLWELDAASSSLATPTKLLQKTAFSGGFLALIVRVIKNADPNCFSHNGVENQTGGRPPAVETHLRKSHFCRLTNIT